MHAVPFGQGYQRHSLLERGDSRLELPEATHLYLIDYLLSLGWGRQGQLEPHHKDKVIYPVRVLEPFDYREIAAWCDLTGHDLTPWEAETLKMLSDAYVVQLNSSHDANAEPPHDARSVEEMRERTHNQFQRLFRQAGGKPSG